ncbi:hypothetical protein HDV04_005054 [Boothiomyces sp. JEL0838]|nr:hypothetical protein HDV04_005054 [Boothiomyces sp. JEL0838]
MESQWLLPTAVVLALSVYFLKPQQKKSFKSNLTTPNDSKIIVCGGGQKTRFPNGSPGVCKLIAFLEYNKIPYEYKTTTNFKESPNEKIPFVHYKGQIISDSHFIIRKLVQDGLAKDPNAGLNESEIAISEMIRTSFESILYWGIVKHRWINNWEHTKEEYFGKMPAILKWFLPDRIILPHVLANLKAVGTTRYEEGQYDILIKEFIRNASVILGSKKYFMGDQITMLDYTAFSNLGNIYHLSKLNGELKAELEKYDNLVDYVKRLTPLFKPNKI